VIAAAGRRWVVFAAAAAYVLAPGPSDAFFRGIPLGLGPFVVLAVGVFAWVFLRPAPEPPRGWARVSAVLAALCIVKMTAALAAPPVGWLGRYYPNDRFAGPYRRSTEFLSLDATRIDRAIDFRDDRFPVYFLNEADFNRGIRREVTFPVTATWDGYVQPSAPTTLSLTVNVRGAATLSVDDRQVIAIASDAVAVAHSGNVRLEPGTHRIRVTYLKPPDTDPLIQVQGLAERSRDAALLVTPRPIGAARRSVLPAATLVARAADALAALTFLFIVSRLAIGWRDDRTTAARWVRAQPVRLLGAAMFAVFLVQGVVAAAPHVGRAVSLSGGDDWLAFEARAREVVTGGLLMRFGRPLGTGEVFYYYPGYSYFLAAVHRLTGEDLSGPILANFLMLVLANVVVYRLAVSLFNQSVALGATAALVAIEELAFMRHYTVTLLSENLYFLTVPLTVLGLVRFLQHGRRTALVWAGLAAGVSAVTRPAMMLFLIPAVCIVAVASSRARPLARAASALVFVASWFAIVLLVTLRNYLVTGVPTLISETPAHSFILYNLPASADANQYMKMYSGGLLSAASVLLRIVVEHPLDSIRGVISKVGFSFGMIQWMGGHPHPELVLASGLYLTALAFSRAARARITWPVHAFVAVHLVGMILTMPSNYGYRLILPMYLFLPMFGAFVVAEAIGSIRGRMRHERATVAPAGRPS
jgi:hypothetical protein